MMNYYINNRYTEFYFMKNVKSFLFVTLLSLSGVALVNASCCSSAKQEEAVECDNGYCFKNSCKKSIATEVEADGCEVLHVEEEVTESEVAE
jgi:hypothetical protein